METIEELDALNETLRTRLLETIRWWEDDLTAGLARERALHVHVENLERQINELNSSLPIRVTRPVVKVRSALRQLWSRL